jgi:hypothetical protein
MFFRGSRYETVADGIYEDPSGRKIPYKLLRVIPDVTGIQAHAVKQGERLDLIAFQFYGDPEQYWRVCDGNRALKPEDLLDPIGRRLVIPLAQR